MKKLDVIGIKFGRLTVLEEAGKDRYGNRLVRCVCDCGNDIICRPSNLNSERTKSCGCARRKPKDKNQRLYRIWIGMRQRCYNQVSSAYKHYGARGICVCDEWKNSFEMFENWAVNNGYKETLSIDRIDVNGNYEPHNCRWVTMKVQNNNKRVFA